jgi:O-antigen/teichoic acid export membrane protein
MQSLRSMAFQILRSSERFFRLDMVYVAKGGLWTTLSFAIGTMASIVTMIAFGNLLPRETYGTYNYLLSLGASLSFLTLSGVGTGVMRAVARGHENVVPKALRFQLKYNLVAVATVMAAAIYYGYKGNLLFAGSLALLALAYPFAEAFHIYIQVLKGKKRFDELTKITSVIILVSTSATVITLLITENVLLLISMYAVMSLIPNVIAYRITARKLDRTEPEGSQVKEMERTAFHLTGAGLIGAAAQYIDKIVIFQAAGPAALAVYAFATAGPERLKGLVKSWISIAMPQLAQRSLPEIRRVMYWRIGFSLLIGITLSAAYFILAPALFRLFLPKYLDAIFYSQIQSLCLVAIPVTVYISSIFSSQNMLKATYALSIGTQISRITLFLVFGFYWQLWGLIIASLVSSVVNALYSLIVWEIEYRRLMLKNE